jgi:hypothetical protein
MNTLTFIQIDVKSRRIGGATQPLGLRWGFEATSDQNALSISSAIRTAARRGSSESRMGLPITR